MPKRLSVAGRKYTNRDNQEKTEWTSVGVLNIDRNGKEYILLDPKINLAGLPIGENGMVMVGVFEEQQQDQQRQPQQQEYRQPDQRPPQQPQYEYQDRNGQQTPPPQQGNRR